MQEQRVKVKRGRAASSNKKAAEVIKSTELTEDFFDFRKKLQSQTDKLKLSSMSPEKALKDDGTRHGLRKSPRRNQINKFDNGIICLDSPLEFRDGSAISLTPQPPSPPPDDLGGKNRTTKRRCPKGFKQAVNKLAKLHKLANEENEDDCILVPTPPRLKFEIKVLIRGKICRFPISMTSPLSELMLQIAKEENVAAESIVIYHDIKLVHPRDTPSSLNLSVADILDCHIKSSNANHVDEDEPNSILLKIQNKQKRINVRVKLLEPLTRTLLKFAEEECNLKTLDGLGFFFDGEEITPEQTPEELELEDNYCIDVTGV